MTGFDVRTRPPTRALTTDAPRLSLRDLPSFAQTITLTWNSPENVAAALSVKVSRAAGGLTIETAGAVTEVELRSWAMPQTMGRLRGVRWRMVCPRCGASRDALHYARGEWGCRGKGCLDLEHPSRHSQRWCPAIRRRARLLRALARCSPRSLRARLLREQIRRAQQAMIVNLKRINRDLTKRVKRYG